MKMFAIVAALVVATALGAPMRAAAENWTVVATDVDKNQYALDTSSIRANGGYVSAWMWITNTKLKWDGSGRKWYKSGKVQRLDNCRENTFALTAYIYLDQVGRVTSQLDVPQLQWQFASAPPGSIHETYHNQICAIFAHRAALKPAVNEGPTTEGDWRAAGYDPIHKVNYDLDMKSIQTLKKGTIGFVTRASGLAPQKLTDGTDYERIYSVMVIDCAGGDFMLPMSDTYDSAGNLVATSTTPTDQLHADPIRPNSLADGIRKIACAAQPSDQAAGAADAAQISSGTAWLGPKGYLVTANHVIEGGAAFVLIQDGKPVGRAEVVLADPANDLAVLRPKLGGAIPPAIPLGERPARLGERVFTLGYPAPDELGVSIKMTAGEVSSLSGDDASSHRTDDVRLLQTSVPIQPGNSGGPLIDSSGHAVGVIVSAFSALSQETIAQNVNYAVKVGYLRNLLEGLPDIGGYRPAKANTTIAAEVAELKGAVFLLMVSSKPDD